MMASIPGGRLRPLWTTLISIIWVATVGYSAASTLHVKIAESMFNVKSFGAVADGETDSTKAILSAWKEACATPGRPRVLIPEGVYMTGPLTFMGPCIGYMVVQLKGELRAHADVKQFPDLKWVSFESVSGMMLTGGGTLNGQGKQAWPHNDCSTAKNCMLLPTSVKLDHCINATIRRINSIDSKFFHMTVDESQHINIHHVNITAPGDSPNTDGIHIGRSSYVKVTKAVIGTGDDCISLGPGSTHISIAKVQCGPGHGISVGSLGRYKDEENVSGVRVKNCTLTGTTNGVRIKTWKGSPPSEASQFYFENIEMNDVLNPIIIDQEYCAYDDCASNPPAPSKVKLSSIQFTNIRGTSASQVAVKLMCSSAVPCQNVQLTDISLKYVGAGDVTMANCSHVNGGASGFLYPPSCINGASESLVTT